VEYNEPAFSAMEMPQGTEMRVSDEEITKTVVTCNTGPLISAFQYSNQLIEHVAETYGR